MCRSHLLLASTTPVLLPGPTLLPSAPAPVLLRLRLLLYAVLMMRAVRRAPSQKEAYTRGFRCPAALFAGRVW